MNHNKVLKSDRTGRLNWSNLEPEMDAVQFHIRNRKFKNAYEAVNRTGRTEERGSPSLLTSTEIQRLPPSSSSSRSLASRPTTTVLDIFLTLFPFLLARYFSSFPFEFRTSLVAGLFSLLC
ncbi:hypothetical protein PIB30_096637 [Stylosanthes scabra]|uniref:Uncharacterized protein n=1 Tax=Stylosanthes scabra TaxID=79078 RepID=A0ABU6ZUQ6_9FABA|nr:hypothetical protein [Stylosanthes scabra]